MWQINGETGKAMDATQRPLGALRIQSARLALRSLASDQLTWTAATENATGSGTLVPEVGQIVELFHGTVRRFRGHVTKAKIGIRSVSVTVEGPWWWLVRTNLTSDQLDATAVSAERASYVFPTQSLKTSLDALLDRAIANGVPMVRGAVDAMFTVPRMTQAERSCAAALAELMCWVPDAVAWFDYSGPTPEIRITRRGTATPLNLTVGADPLEDLEISPRLDLEVSRVELNFVDRNPTTGRPRWQQQASGAAVAGKRQIITVSGPEIVDFLPKDDFASVRVRSRLIADLNSAQIIGKDSALASIQEQFGGVFGAPGGTTFGEWVYWTGTSTAKVKVTRTFPALSVRSLTGDTIPTATKYFVTSTDALPEWARTALGAVEVEVSGWWIAGWKDSERGTVGWSETFMAMQTGADLKSNVWENNQPYSGSGPHGSADFRVDWLARPITLRGFLINTFYSANTSVYKPWDYDYLNPPAGLAVELAAAQNWVPWEGTVGLVDTAATGANLLARKVNLAGCLPACATMGAMLNGMSYELLSERTIYELGAPARTDFGSLVSRIRREPKDNIVYI